MDPLDALETLLDLAADGIADLGLEQAVDGLLEDGLVLDFADLLWEQLADNTPVEQVLAGSAEGADLFGALELPECATGSAIDLPAMSLEADFPIDYQDATHSCTLAATSQALSELGVEQSVEQILAEVAQDEGVYQPGVGTNLLGLGDLLERVSDGALSAEVTHFGDVGGQLDASAVSDVLRGGDKLLVDVDASEIWEGTPDAHDLGASRAHTVMIKDYHSLTDQYDIVDPDPNAGGFARVSGARFRAAWGDTGFLGLALGPSHA